MPEHNPNRPGNQSQGQRGPGRPPGLRPSGPSGGLFIWILIFGLLTLGVYTLVRQARRAQREQIGLSQFYQRLDAGKIATAEIRRNMVTGRYAPPIPPGEPQEYMVRILEAEVENLSRTLAEYNRTHDPDVEYDQEPGSEFLQFFLVQLLPILFIVFIIWYLLARQFRSAGGTGSVLSFGKARARLHTKEKSNVTFDQVAGVDEAKEEVLELVEFLKNPAKFRRLGGRIPRGILLVGPPGCGKTLLAKAIAGEADVPFFSMSGSDFVEMFVGVGASRVRDLFRQAKENAPCIIFLDEIDAVGRRRAIDLHGASAEGAQTLNAILVEMDGFETDDNVIVIAATNRPDVLDPALLRPGRFDRQIIVDLPDIRGREAILRVHARKYKLAPDVDLRQLARGTPMFSGADLEALMNEAALLATRAGKNAVDMDDLEEARDKVRWGRQRRSREMTEEDRHPPGHGPGPDHVAPRARPLPHPAQAHAGTTLHPHGRQGGRVHVLRRHHLRRPERPGPGHGPRPQHGLPMGHERAGGTGELPRDRGAHVPGTRPGGQAQGLLRGHGREDRRGDLPPHQRGPGAGQETHLRTPRRAGAHGPGPPQVRGAPLGRRGRHPRRQGGPQAAARPAGLPGGGPEGRQGGTRRAGRMTLATRTTSWTLRLPNGGTLALGGDSPARVMGVLNVTPDSFSDGGRFLDPGVAVDHAERMQEEGADLVDVGGESTRPGSDPVPPAEQIRRVIPVIERLAPRLTIPLSIDTTSAEVARAALDAGAQMVNDVSALRGDPEMGPLVARRGAPVVLMHMLGRPKDMQVNPTYRDVVGEVAGFLRERIRAATDLGIGREQIVVDPGFGFGKRLEHNLELLRRLEELAALGRPILVGTSRKSMLGEILGAPPEGRLHGTTATVAAAVERGAAMVRVHDVRPAVDVVKVLAAIHGRRWR